MVHAQHLVKCMVLLVVGLDNFNLSMQVSQLHTDLHYTELCIYFLHDRQQRKAS
jgi:hypothetical protein